MRSLSSAVSWGHARPRLPTVAILLLCTPALVMTFCTTGCAPEDGSHPLESLAGSETIEEAASSDGTASKSVSSRWTAPDRRFDLSIQVNSPEPLFVGNAQVQVTLTCQLGTTKSFPVDLAFNTAGQLVGNFSHTPDAADGSECVGIGGQKEAAKWTVVMSRPHDTTQELTFSYTMDYRLASIETP